MTDKEMGLDAEMKEDIDKICCGYETEGMQLQMDLKEYFSDKFIHRLSECNVIDPSEPKRLPENLDEHFYGETRRITISNTRAINAILDYLREAQK